MKPVDHIASIARESDIARRESFLEFTEAELLRQLPDRCDAFACPEQGGPRT